MDGFGLMMAAIDRLPVPTGAVAGSGDGAAIGLSFLETSQRLNHIRRLTERITLKEHGSVTKTTELDVAIGLLDASQLEASRQFQAHQSPRKLASPGVTIWAPIARLPQSTASPLDVTNSNQTLLPRLTQYETSRLVAAGLFRLLKSILSAQNSAAHHTDAELFLHKVDESRWLVESAIYALLTTRGDPPAPDDRIRTPGTVQGPGRKVKEFTIGVLNDHQDSLSSFFDLLEVAFHDYIIVVGLDADLPEQTLRFEWPISVTTTSRSNSWSRQGPRDLTGYRVNYSSQLPPTLKAYHLVFETEEDLTIHPMCLITDAETSLAESVAADLESCANRLAEHSDAPLPSQQLKFLELEAQRAIRAAAEIGRRRMWEAQFFTQDMDLTRTSNLANLMWVIASGEATVVPGDAEYASILQHPLISPESLDGAANELRNFDLGRTVATSKGPPSSTSHAYWRRNSELRAGSAPLVVNASCVVRDDGELRPWRLFAYACGMSLLTWLLVSFLAGGPWPFHQVQDGLADRDAIVAVLLLVPGFLYSRLDLGRRGTISAELRRFSRTVAATAVSVSAIAAAAVAGGAAGVWLDLIFALAILTPIISGFFFLMASRRVHGPYGIREIDPPDWVKTDDQKTPLQVDVVVASVHSYEDWAPYAD